MDNSVHAEQLGGLVGNLQSLEFAIRLCLAQKPGSLVRDVYTDNFRGMPVGTTIPESDMSNFASLAQLVREFNSSFGDPGSSLLDGTLVALRDVLAHGRVFAGPDDQHFRIVKFDKPHGGRARISYNQVMTDEWFSENKKRVRDAIQVVMTTFNEQASKVGR